MRRVKDAIYIGEDEKIRDIKNGIDDAVSLHKED